MRSELNNLSFQLGVHDPISLQDDVWGIEHIMMMLRSKNKDLILGLVKSEGFPLPLANQKRNRRWLAMDVKEFFEKRSQGHLPSTSPTLDSNTHLTPKRINYKESGPRIKKERNENPTQATHRTSRQIRKSA